VHVRRSPPTQRVTTLLDALAAQPGRAFTLSELVERTGISKATCLGIVNELCHAGYLVREATTYTLGPALLAAGASAQRGFPSLPLARPHMARLADELGAACTASAVVGGDVVVLARAGDGAIAPAVRPGQRFPFVPPSGVMFVAWDDDATVDAWLSTTPLAPDAPGAATLREVVDACRGLGYLAEELGEFNLGLYSRLAGLLDELPGRYAQVVGEMMATITQQSYIRYVTDAPDPGRVYALSHVCAPVYDADGRMELLLAAFLMRGDVSGDELERVAAALRDTAAEVTAASGGRDPWSAVPSAVG
jgi:DNA-binding IclR family transcriptional regulator